MKRKSIKYHFILLLFLMASSSIFAQQLPAADLYFNNLFFVNPATAGDAGCPRFAVLNRRQWVNIESAPMTSFFALDMPVKGKLGVGMNLVFDQTSFLRNVKGSISARYKLKLRNNQHLSVGINTAIYDTYLNFANVKAEDYSDDILLIGNANRALAIGADFGINYQVKNWQIGAYHSQLFNNSKQSYFNSTLSSYRMQAHYGGYITYKKMLNESFSMLPRIGFRYLPGVYMQADLGVAMEWKNKVNVGLMYRTQETVSASVYYKINDMFSFAYSYGYGLQGISAYSGGTHEVMLQMLLRGKDKDKEEWMIRQIDSLGLTLKDLDGRNKKLDSLNKDLEKRVVKLEEMSIQYVDSITILRMIQTRVKFVQDSLDQVQAPQMRKGKRYVIENIHFEFNSAKIKKESEITLDQVVTYLNAYPNVIMEVDGHTDAIGSDAANQKLSVARAKAVVKYLVDHGISASRLSHRGYGETMPVDVNTTDAGRALNRRIEFIILREN